MSEPMNSFDDRLKAARLELAGMDAADHADLQGSAEEAAGVAHPTEAREAPEGIPEGGRCASTAARSAEGMHPPTDQQAPQGCPDARSPAARKHEHGAGLRVMTDVFLTDLTVKLGEPNARYLEFYYKGADALQTDLPDEVAKAIGRKVPPE